MAEQSSTDVVDVDGFVPVRLLRVFWPLAAVAALICVVAAGTFAGHLLTEGRTSQNFHHVFYFFDVGREYNLPTWYASLLWGMLGVLAALYAALARRRRWAWALFAVVAFTASVDEFLELHERLDAIGNALQPYLPFTLWFTWVLAGAPVLLVVAALLLRLVLSLPSAARTGILVAGAMFGLGAIGVETLGGLRLVQAGGIPDPTFIAITLVEEFLEMTALALAVASLLSLVERDRGERAARLVRTL